MATMKAVVIREKGGPEVLKLETLPIPTPKDDEVLIRVKAFGLNRSELFTREGHSPGVQFPRVLGIEAVGIVEQCPSGELKVGDKVATCMGGMGRDFDGGYAEYTCVKANNVHTIHQDLDWTTLGAMPEMLQTAWGSLFSALKLQPTDRLLIRGGTSSVGLVAAAIAKSHGCYVAATTRNPSKESREVLRRNGVDQVIIDNGKVSDRIHPLTYDKVLELVGTATLEDSLQCAAADGIVCMTGILGNKWHLDDFKPMEAIPKDVYLTKYGGGPKEFQNMPFGDLEKQVKAGTLKIPIGKVLHIDDIVKAHELMDQNLARGKIVVLT